MVFSQKKTVQSTVDSFITPSDVGRIPARIASGFSGFTADQWRNSTLLYSLSSLKSILPHRHYTCWQLFVKSYLFCRRSVHISQVEEADHLMLEFCNMFETLYGKEHCTVNIHLHGHLKVSLPRGWSQGAWFREKYADSRTLL